LILLGRNQCTRSWLTSAVCKLVAKETLDAFGAGFGVGKIRVGLIAFELVEQETNHEAAGDLSLRSLESSGAESEFEEEVFRETLLGSLVYFAVGGFTAPVIG